jgi:ketohexokinase
MANVLAVGVATLDIVNEVEAYPAEDSEVRALAQSVRRGGNASNTAVVLSQLGHSCEWAGVLVDGPDARPILGDFEKYQIGTRHCRFLPHGKVPTSYITLSRTSASRTIVHYRDLPEFEFQCFGRIPLRAFEWVHFEGRNVSETLLMMRQAGKDNPQLRVSLELEKPRDNMEKLFPHADLILFSPAVAEYCGYAPERFLQEVRRSAPDAHLVCTLGEQGAVALSSCGEFIRSEAYPPARLVDTIGAGDTFTGAMIDALLRDASLAQALPFACQLAGIKCGQAGFQGLKIPAGCE